MSGLCGWLDGVETERIGPVLERMAAPIHEHDHARVLSLPGRRGALAAAGLGAGTSVGRDGAKLAAIWGDAYFTDPRLEAEAREHGTAQTYLRHCYARPAGGLQAVCGSFALAVLDEEAGTALLAVDRFAVRPLVYAAQGGCLLFASSADAIRLHPRAAPELDPQGIYNYVHFHMVPAPGTIYRGWRRLLPGHFLRYADGKAETAPYWEMRFEEDVRRPFPELKREFLDTLGNAVRRAADGGEVGAFLSGGTDSSTIAGLITKVTGAPARTYSIGFAAEGFDEIEYARIAARHFATRHREYYVTPDDVVAAIPRIASVHDQPFGNSSAAPTYYCAKLARDDGVTTLLGGDGGDELFGGNARYATQYLYSLYSDLPELARKGLIEPVLFCMPEMGLFGKAQRYIRSASLPMPARYDNYNLLERLGMTHVFTAGFLAAVDPAQAPRMMAETYRDARADSLINRMLALDLKYTLADNDLPKVTRSCELAGTHARFPMLDDSVVAFSATLAPRLKLKRTRLRYFFKEALRGFLPEDIIVKKKHGFGLPFGAWLVTHDALRELALDSLTDLKQRRIVRPEFVDELVSQRMREHAGYYSTMVWVLMMLEQWFRRPGAPSGV